MDSLEINTSLDNLIRNSVSHTGLTPQELVDELIELACFHIAIDLPVELNRVHCYGPMAEVMTGLLKKYIPKVDWQHNRELNYSLSEMEAVK